MFNIRGRYVQSQKYYNDWHNVVLSKFLIQTLHVCLRVISSSLLYRARVNPSVFDNWRVVEVLWKSYTDYSIEQEIEPFDVYKTITVLFVLGRCKMLFLLCAMSCRVRAQITSRRVPQGGSCRGSHTLSSARGGWNSTLQHIKNTFILIHILFLRMNSKTPHAVSTEGS